MSGSTTHLPSVQTAGAGKPWRRIGRLPSCAPQSIL